MSFPEMPWQCVATHPPNGRQIFQRTVDFEHTGNNEGTMTDAIEVRAADGTVLAAIQMTIDWEYFGSIDAAFGDDGTTVTVTGSGAERKKLRILPVDGTHHTEQ